MIQTLNQEAFSWLEVSGSGICVFRRKKKELIETSQHRPSRGGVRWVGWVVGSSDLCG